MNSSDKQNECNYKMQGRISETVIVDVKSNIDDSFEICKSISKLPLMNISTWGDFPIYEEFTSKLQHRCNRNEVFGNIVTENRDQYLWRLNPKQQIGDCYQSLLNITDFSSQNINCSDSTIRPFMCVYNTTDPTPSNCYSAHNYLQTVGLYCFFILLLFFSAVYTFQTLLGYYNRVVLDVEVLTARLRRNEDDLIWTAADETAQSTSQSPNSAEVANDDEQMRGGELDTISLASCSTLEALYASLTTATLNFPETSQEDEAPTDTTKEVASSAQRIRATFNNTVMHMKSCVPKPTKKLHKVKKNLVSRLYHRDEADEAAQPSSNRRRLRNIHHPYEDFFDEVEQQTANQDPSTSRSNTSTDIDNSRSNMLSGVDKPRYNTPSGIDNPSFNMSSSINDPCSNTSSGIENSQSNTSSGIENPSFDTSAGTDTSSRVSQLVKTYETPF